MMPKPTLKSNSVRMICTDPPYGDLSERTEPWLDLGDVLMAHLSNLIEEMEDGNEEDEQDSRVC